MRVISLFYARKTTPSRNCRTILNMKLYPQITQMHANFLLKICGNLRIDLTHYCKRSKTFPSFHNSSNL
jgi:hypothetical protein